MMDIERDVIYIPKSKRKLKKIIRKICNENKK